MMQLTSFLFIGLALVSADSVAKMRGADVLVKAVKKDHSQQFANTEGQHWLILDDSPEEMILEIQPQAAFEVKSGPEHNMFDVVLVNPKALVGKGGKLKPISAKTVARKKGSQSSSVQPALPSIPLSQLAPPPVPLEKPIEKPKKIPRLSEMPLPPMELMEPKVAKRKSVSKLIPLPEPPPPPEHKKNNALAVVLGEEEEEEVLEEAPSELERNEIGVLFTTRKGKLVDLDAIQKVADISKIQILIDPPIPEIKFTRMVGNMAVFVRAEGFGFVKAKVGMRLTIKDKDKEKNYDFYSELPEKDDGVRWVKQFQKIDLSAYFKTIPAQVMSLPIHGDGQKEQEARRELRAAADREISNLCYEASDLYLKQMPQEQRVLSQFEKPNWGGLLYISEQNIQCANKAPDEEGMTVQCRAKVEDILKSSAIRCELPATLIYADKHGAGTHIVPPAATDFQGT